MESPDIFPHFDLFPRLQHIGSTIGRFLFRQLPEEGYHSNHDHHGAAEMLDSYLDTSKLPHLRDLPSLEKPEE